MDIAHCYLDGNTDAVEFCPHDGFTNILAASTYTLREGDCPGRDGSIVLFDVGNDSKRHLEVLHSLKCAGVFDIKWCPAEAGNGMGPLLARADSEGFVGIHCLEQSPDGQNNTYLLKEERCEKISSSMCLCLDWNPSATAISVGLSDGSVSVLSFTESNLEIQQQWSAHEFETWAASFDLHNPHLVYSGSDDCNFVCWDTRDSPSNPVFHNSKVHTMGVCCIAKSITDPHIVLTGSYDEHIRVWDIRSTSKAMNVRSLCLGGGVWRIKQHFSVPGLVLTACMHNGFAIVDVTGEDVKVLETYKKHDSLAYGADWQREKDGVVATCSFYDQLLRMWVPECKISSSLSLQNTRQIDIR